MNQNTMKGMGKLIEKLEKKRMYTEVKTTPSTGFLLQEYLNVINDRES